MSIELVKLVLIGLYVLLALGMFDWEIKRSMTGATDITPKYFYNEKKFNWFGSWISFIGLCLISPIGLFIKLIGLLYDFIKWLFTVGRDAEDEKSKEGK